MKSTRFHLLAPADDHGANDFSAIFDGSPPANDAGEGGSYDDEPPPTEGESDDGRQPVEEPAPAQTPATPTPFDPNQLTDAIVNGLRQAQQPAQQPAAQMTAEEVDKALKRFYVSEEMAQSLFDGDTPLQTRQKILQDIVTGSVTQALTTASYMQDYRLQEVQQQISPIVQQAREQQARTFVAGMEKQYPGLKGQTQAMDFAADQLKQENFQPKSAADAQQALAKRAEALIKQFNPQFTLTAASHPNAGGNNTAPTTMSTSGGGAQRPTKGSGINTKQATKQELASMFGR